MATTSYITFLLFALTTASSMAMAADHVNPNSSKSHELQIATDEMARANYFTFVTLINIMSPLDNTLQQNVTFLMPNDRILSTTTIPSDFLLRHSIPSPLLFDHLQHIPSGSTIPSSDSDFKLYINNNGRRSFYLNNVRLISPNLCTAGHSIRCHGIDGVLAAPVTDTTPASSCSNSTTPVVTEAPPAPLLAPAAAPEPVQHIDLRKTSGSCMSHIEASFNLCVSFFFMLIMGLII
ncbi:FAS1 domain-containing protein SELMODRAFT_448915 [Euphorbia lathyris]|uniref:FAS1 domain-containing protein SELMODRAFT_448915 n=1 Tax=Euphorbia lathyris TaxID=212925 RepID=UPI0033140FFD